MKINTSPVRGTIDYLPKDMEIRQNVYNIIIKSFKENGYLQIKTPILESLAILTNGDSGDNQKLMFKTIKRGEKLKLDKTDLTEADIVEEGLRYDLTVPLARLYAGNREKLPFPFKAIQIDDSFRAERPQRGRYRQFTQCDIDIWGDSSVNAEIDLLVAAINTYEKIGFTKLKLKVNDRRILAQVIVNAGFSEDKVIDVNISLDKLDKIGTDGVKE
ncbi:MAG: ATP phosphoribosyltransferase regulatory subunit [Clostridia bacterium]|nr:ATP phosphoribosyltransferase regulatory subunit [Clostridia bacterium]